MRSSTLAGIALISAATLLLEITLTRLFSLVQWYHFAFMAVGIGLLGFGASGTLLTAFPVLRDMAARVVAATAAIPATAVAYLALQFVPFDAYRIALEPAQFAYLGVQVLALVLPFLCAGLAVVGVLAADPEHAGPLYGASLAGSGLGCLLAVGVLRVLPAAHALVIVAALNAAGAAALVNLRRARMALLALAIILLAVAPFADLPLRFSPYKAFSQYRLFPDSRIVFTKWSPVARVDAIRSRAIHSAAGLSTAYRGTPPPVVAVTIDGDAPRPLPESAKGEFTEFLPSSVVYALRRGPTLVIDGGAGLDVLAALHHGMPEVTVADANGAIVEAAMTLAQPVYGDRRVHLVREDSRVFARRARQQFAVIQISPRESFQVVASGAFSLTEHYLYTVEAISDFSHRLAPDGILVITRWLQQPPSEEAKVWAAAATALDEMGLDPASHLAAIRSLNTMTVLMSRRPWTPQDVAWLWQFASSRRFDIVYAPDVTAADANRYSVLLEDVYHAAFVAMLRPQTRAAYIAASPFDLRPARDSRPFFFHFFRWRQVPEILAGLGRTWQPFGGGGYLVLLGAVGIVLGISVVLILLPLRRLGPRPRDAGGIFGYFLLLGVGYLFLEIPILQQFILLLGHPTYSLSVVLFGLLTSSGAGSILSPRVRHLSSVLLVLAATVAIAATATGPLIRMALGFPLAVRVLTALAVVGLMGLPMGVPFAVGLRGLASRPALVPWAWAINGCASVVSSTAAVLAAVQWGFPAVLVLGAAAYAAAGLIARRAFAQATPV